MSYYTIISYDIVDDRRRQKLANSLLDYGTRVQYSVFELNINKKLLEELMEKINSIIDLEEDSVRFYFLCGSCNDRIVNIGLDKGYDKDSDYLII